MEKEDKKTSQEKKVEDIVEKRKAEIKQKRQSQEQTGDSHTNKRK